MRKVIIEKISKKDKKLLLLSAVEFTDLLIDDIKYFQNKRHFIYRETYPTEYIYWNYLIKETKLPQNFIVEFKHRLNGRLLCEYQKLSEKTIRELLKYKIIDFIDISLHQKDNLSEDFIREFKENIFWFYINLSENLSKEFREEFKEELASLPF